MSVLAQVFAGVVALIHVVVFVWEAFLFSRPGVHYGIFRVPSEDVPAVRLWTFGQGFYNLFLAGGTIAGLVALHNGNEAIGRALVLYTCIFVLLSGFVLVVSDRMALGRPKGSGLSGAASQIVPALVVLIAA